MTLAGLRIVIVGPLPPPEGGMANQTRELAELLEREGAKVRLVRTNSPYRPFFVQQLRFIREPFRFVPYVFQLWRAAAHADIFHVMANSGWAWHLRAAPAVLIASARGISCVVNYRGGEGMGERLGSRVQVQIDRVGQIPREASGKYRYLVSRFDARRMSKAVA